MKIGAHLYVLNVENIVMSKLILFLLLFQQSEKGIGTIHKKKCNTEYCVYTYKIVFPDTIEYRSIDVPVIIELSNTRELWRVY